MLRRVTVSWARARARMLCVLTGVALSAGCAVWLLAAPGDIARAEIVGPPTDLLALGLGVGQTPATVPVQRNPEPPLEATPPAVCGPGSHPLDGMQGRVPASAINSPADANGYWCNLQEIAHQGQSGGFKVFRYIDRQGHECAFYDTALLFPLNAVRLAGPSLGVAVLDMSDPAHPVQTDTLTSLPMMSPHESLSLNTRRGLLAAVLGNPATYPGLVSIYDVSADCRHPVLDSTALVARFGHEGNFSPDGNTFYAAGTSVESITAIDVTDPKNPTPIWQGNEYSHGLTLSDDGNRAYVADPINGQLLILDTSEIQARKPNPQVREISRLTWGPVTIPQNAIPITIKGTPYLLEFDEYAFRFSSPAPPDTVGAARLIDISDEQHPRVVSNLRLAVNQPDGHSAASGDPGASSPVQGYAAHYCNVPQENDPGIVACSFISSGLRVFDIHDPLQPKEIAYYVAPPHFAPENLLNGSNFAMSKPAFAPERREIWYTDGTSGFYVLRLPANLWPDAAGAPPAAPPAPVAARACPAATGRLSGRRLGPVVIGQRRTLVRGIIARYPGRRSAGVDSICLSGGSLAAVYPSDALLRTFGSARRRQLAGRVIAAVSTDPHYALAGLHPGASFTGAVRRLGLRLALRTRTGAWYVSRGRGVIGLVDVTHRVVKQVGIGGPPLAATRTRLRRALLSVP